MECITYAGNCRVAATCTDSAGWLYFSVFWLEYILAVYRYLVQIECELIPAALIQAIDLKVHLYQSFLESH